MHSCMYPTGCDMLTEYCRLFTPGKLDCTCNVCVREREKEERESVCVCVCERERGRETIDATNTAASLLGGMLLVELQHMLLVEHAAYT